MSTLKSLFKEINWLYFFYGIMMILILVVSIFVLPNVHKQEISSPAQDVKKEAVQDIADFGDINDGGKNLTVNSGNCEYSELADFKYIDIYEGEVHNKENSYSKNISVSGKIDEAYLCVVANVEDMFRGDNKTYYLYVLFNNEDYGGVVNVGKTLSGTYYDYKTSSKHPELDGRMYGSELKESDKSYWLDLREGFWVADKGKGIKKIKPIEVFNSNKSLFKVGGVLSNGEQGIIKKFRIFYKGGNISIK